MNLQIISPDGSVLNTEAEVVKMPGVEGQFTILEGHAPMIAALKSGSIFYQKEGQKKELKIESGFAEVADDEIKVCID